MKFNERATGALTTGFLYDEPERQGECREVGKIDVTWWRPGPGIDPFRALVNVAGVLGLDLKAPYTKLARLKFHFSSDGKEITADSRELSLEGGYVRLQCQVEGQWTQIWIWLSSLPAPGEVQDPH